MKTEQYENGRYRIEVFGRFQGGRPVDRFATEIMGPHGLVVIPGGGSVNWAVNGVREQTPVVNLVLQIWGYTLLPPGIKAPATSWFPASDTLKGRVLPISNVTDDEFVARAFYGPETYDTMKAAWPEFWVKRIRPEMDEDD